LATLNVCKWVLAASFEPQKQQNNILEVQTKTVVKPIRRLLSSSAKEELSRLDLLKLQEKLAFSMCFESIFGRNIALFKKIPLIYPILLLGVPLTNIAN
jgi:hypothetical protein